MAGSTDLPDGNVSAANASTASSPRSVQVTGQQVACLPCREAKQRCSKGTPCQRCLSSRLDCRYPSRSNRGRKRGSTNKPDTVEKLLSRLNKSSMRNEVIAALHDSVAEHGDSASASPHPPTPGESSMRQSTHDDRMSPKQHHSASLSYLDCHQPTYSPLEILAAAVATQRHSSTSPDASFSKPQQQPAWHGSALSPTLQSHRQSSETLAADKMIELYFTPRTLEQTDWQVLALQPAGSTLQLQSTLHDPINSRLIDSDDAVLYFDLFYKLRNPFVGLLDPLLHTPQFVRSSSFTLFSVICALGCAMSDRARDKLLCSALLVLAESNIKWSIAASVKTVETIQAIINMTYWAPLAERQCDETYWLRLTHAAQLAREMGINRPEVVAQKVNAVPDLCEEGKERRQRNYERTWLYVFISDKSFGIATGRPLCVSWKELMPDVANWWQNKGTTPVDRLICGIAEMRLIVVKAFEARQMTSRTKPSVLHWRRETFDAVSKVRSTRCSLAEPSSIRAISSILSFYLDYSLVLINSYALRDLIGLGIVDDLAELTGIYQQSIEVISRMMDLILFDSVMPQLMVGVINPQLVMLCHIATEVIQAAKRGTLPEAVASAATKVRMVANSLENVKRAVPCTSWVALYSTLYSSFVVQLDQVLASDVTSTSHDINDTALSGWWDPIGGGLLDLSNWLETDISGLNGPT